MLLKVFARIDWRHCHRQVRELEVELDAEQRRGRDAIAENRKLHRLVAELRAQYEEEHRLSTELTDQVNSLSLKIAILKRQLLEAVSCQIHLNQRGMNSLGNISAVESSTLTCVQEAAFVWSPS